MMMKKNAKMIFSTIILIFMFVLAGSVVVMASTDTSDGIDPQSTYGDLNNDPQDPYDDTDSDDPEDPYNPVDPYEPEDPYNPVDPYEPEDPYNPVDPYDPVDPYGEVDSDTVDSLTIQKTVTGNQGDVEREFNFTVILTDAEDNALTGSYAYSGSKEGTIANGGKVALKSGESITITDLPVGTKYSVIEEEANRGGYTTDVIGGSGVIDKENDNIAAFRNHKSVHKPSKPADDPKPEDPKDEPQVDTAVDEPPVELDDPDTPLGDMILDPIDVPLGNYMTALQDQPSQQLDSAKDATPNTGDNSATVAWATVLVCSLMGMGVLLAKKH